MFILLAPQYMPSGCPPGNYIITELGVNGAAQNVKQMVTDVLRKQKNMMASNNSSGCVRGEVAHMRVT